MMSRTLAVAAALSLSLPAFAGFPPASLTSFGDAVSFGDGEVRTFLTTAPNGKPIFFGIEFDPTWDSLPMHGDHHDNSLLLPMPEGSEGTVPFKHVTFDWNPHGHFPPGVYDVPHVDFHFYLISIQERMSIEPGECDGLPLTCDSLEKALAPLSPEAQPPFHFDVGAVEPHMGNHLLDFRSPEFGPEGFSNTFIYGKWDGAIAFMEPMVTRAHFETLEATDCRDIDSPQGYAEAGYYPTVYCVRAGAVNSVTYEAFEWFDAVD